MSWKDDRTAFIAQYCDASGIPEEYRTPTGYRLGTIERVAIPCSCEEEGCEDWAMVPTNDVMMTLHRAGFVQPWAIRAESEAMSSHILVASIE